MRKEMQKCAVGDYCDAVAIIEFDLLIGEKVDAGTKLQRRYTYGIITMKSY